MPWFFRKKNRKGADDLFFSGSPEKRYFSVEGKYRYNWVQAFFSKNEPLDEAVGSRERFLGNSLTKKKIMIIGGVFWMLLFALMWRVGDLQLFRGRDLLLAAEDNRFRFYAQPAQRGIIYDRNGIPLVKNLPTFALAISPRDILPYPERRQTINELLELSDEQAIAIFDIPNALQQESLIVKENMSFEEALQIKVAGAAIPWIYLFDTSYREYLLDSSKSLAHVLGYVGKMSAAEWDEVRQDEARLQDLSYEPTDTIGKQGIEKTYEQILRGVFGKVQVEVDAQGRQGRQINSVRAIPGESVILSLDANIQSELESIMERWMQTMGKARGSAVAINPQNGEVLALVSLPTYDSNAFVQGLDADEFAQILEDEDRPLFARAIGGQYPSGSVVKPFVAAAALQEGIITSNSTFASTGGLQVARWFFKDWKAGGHGLVNVRKAIADSVNTFFYIVGGGYNTVSGLGVERINAYLQQFGFGQTTGIDLPGEIDGFIPTPDWKESTKEEIWYIGDTYNLSIGQGDFLTSPLQMTVATAAIANGGTLYKPRLVQGIARSGNIISNAFEPEITNAKMIAPEHIQTIREGMRQTVTRGTAIGLSGLPVAVAAKTGTAQWSSLADPHAWFTSFAPYQRPEIALTVMIEEGESGGVISARIAREFYSWWAQYRTTSP